MGFRVRRRLFIIRRDIGKLAKALLSLAAHAQLCVAWPQLLLHLKTWTTEAVGELCLCDAPLHL